MTISASDFALSKPADSAYNLANISDFNSLIAQSQKFNVPVFALTNSQIEQVGKILDTMGESRDNFKETFDKLAASVEIIAGI
ncbi:hypothetical protein BOSEA31B_14782 [Hyphomicrobiales bacterium]|nr:hypothetical protein BOSEA31B_14782 [Hyphomicrobiales bacterium]CAH1701273.1 hypothetical protein BOSEA1005_20972 [Hyphomicrobiales bacterium]CAI0345235.1 hypothetical protein BO1005MUT1_380030 [Hyphomicrobiales bacterium]